MLLTLLSLLLPVILIAGLWLWLRALQRLQEGRPILEYEPRRPVPWDIVDLVVALFLAAVGQSLAVLALRWVGPAAEYLRQDEPVPVAQWSVAARGAMIFAGSAANLIAMMGSVVVTHLRTGASWRDLGVGRASLLADVKLGALAFTMLAPPVYLVQLVLVQFVPSKHPLIELLKQNPDPWFFVLSGFSAVLVAPLAEEYVFRLLLQGWLEKVGAYGGRAGWISTAQDFVRPWPAGHEASETKSSSAEAIPASRSNEQDSAGVKPRPSLNPYESPLAAPGRAAGDEPTATGGELDEASRPAPFWPILVSSAVFSLLHYQHGPDWIPLFILALGLGYLYWRTHRIVASVTVHFLLNGLTMLLLLAEIFAERS